MKGFRLLALRPLKGTKKKFRKNLKPQVIYKFYQEFKFIDENENEIRIENGNLKSDPANIIYPPDLAGDIYSTNHLNISISAVVGQNGSGKSSLIDLYNIILYYLACMEFKTMEPTSVQTYWQLAHLLKFATEFYDNTKQNHPLEKEIPLSFSFDREFTDFDLLAAADVLAHNLELRYKSDLPQIADPAELNSFVDILQYYTIEAANSYGIPQQKNSHETPIAYKELNRAIAVKLRKLSVNYNIEKDFNQILEEGLFFQLYYQLDDAIYVVEKNQKGLQPIQNRFFYTILLNYSLHSMNSKSLGNWIFKLFHKNDGYQTPNVINPYRKDGIIDVNSELALSTDRLVYNMLDQFRKSHRAEILSKYKFKKFILKLKEKHVYNFGELPVPIEDKEAFLEFLYVQPDYEPFEKDKNSIKDFCVGYLIKKFQKISGTYMDHFYESDALSATDTLQRMDEIVESQRDNAKSYLKSSESHVARKFNQTYNFLADYDELSSNLDFIKGWNIYQQMEITEKDLKEWIIYAEGKYGLKEKGTHELINHLFPAIFDVDIEFENNKHAIKLSDLSSGEQQYIFNINTITYHINNLKTIEPIKGSKIKNYQHVNIILDEIELYYHPEYQKSLIQDLLDEIIKIDSLGELKNFNLLFLTHSPFILSDIPNQNILRLEEGKPSNNEFEPTFGANIHDLLANDFFLKGFMGEFAKNYIKGIIEEIGKIPEKNQNEYMYMWFLKKIELIGEPVIKNSIKSILDKKFDEVFALRKRREELERELSDVNRKLS